MSVVAGTIYPPHFYRRGRVAVLILALLFGLLSLAAVDAVRIDCENSYLTGNGQRLTGNGGFLTLGPPQYWLVAGGARVPLPAWGYPLVEMGWLPSECR